MEDVDILVLIDEDVRPALLVVRAHLCVFGEQRQRQQQQIGEIQRSACLLRRGVGRGDLPRPRGQCRQRRRLRRRPGIALAKRPLQLINIARRPRRFFVLAGCEQRRGLFLREDRQRQRQAEYRRLLGDDAQPEFMESGHRRVPGKRQRRQACGHTCRQLLRRAVREGESEDAGGVDGCCADQPAHALHQGEGFPGARPGDDEQRCGRIVHRMLLLLAQSPWVLGVDGRRGGLCRRRRGLHTRFLRRLRRHAGEERDLPEHLGAFLLAEDGDHAVFAIISWQRVHRAGAHFGNGPREEFAAGGADLRRLRLAQQVEFRPNLRQQLLVALLHALAGGGTLLQLGEDFREREEVLIGEGTGRRLAVRAIRQLRHPVIHAQRQQPAAYRAAAIVRLALRGQAVEIALPVAVDMVFAFLREELQRAQEARRRHAPQGVHHRVIAHLAGEDIGLACQFRRRVRVRVAHQRIAVELRDAPVHRRVGGEPGLQREDLPAQNRDNIPRCC